MKLNSLKVVLMFISLSFLTVSCGDKRDDVKGGLVPTISAISPESGQAGSIITIIGSEFGTDKSKVSVKFNAISATNIISIIDSKIEVEAPDGFSDQTVHVKVFVSEKSSEGKEFYFKDVTPPEISSITASCFYNSIIVIRGNNFSQEKDDNIVKFGTAEGTVTEATKTSLTVIAPNLGASTSADVTITKAGMVSNAQSISVDIDQNKIATYDWNEDVIKQGVVYKTGQFSLFGSSIRRIHVLDVMLNESNALGIGIASPHKNTVAICNDYDAIVGVNAGYFPISGATDKDPYIRIDGATVQEGHLGVSQIFTNSALIIHNNVASVRKFTESGRNLNLVAASIPISQAQNIIVSGPMLIKSGVLEDLDVSNSHNTSSTARTGLGVSADGKRVFMVVVDYNQGATGVSTLQLAKILQALGAVDAMNFDGGGSSTMFVKNKGDNGRVSVNTQAQRAVKSVIYVK